MRTKEVQGANGEFVRMGAGSCQWKENTWSTLWKRELNVPKGGLLGACFFLMPPAKKGKKKRSSNFKSTPTLDYYMVCTFTIQRKTVFITENDRGAFYCFRRSWDGLRLPSCHPATGGVRPGPTPALRGQGRSEDRRCESRLLRCLTTLPVTVSVIHLTLLTLRHLAG